MSKEQKLIARLMSLPKDFTIGEMTSLLTRLGFKMSNKGATSGSRVAFIKKDTGDIIRLHKPHPGNELGPATLKDVVDFLRERGYI